MAVKLGQTPWSLIEEPEQYDFNRAIMLVAEQAFDDEILKKGIEHAEVLTAYLLWRL